MPARTLPPNLGPGPGLVLWHEGSATKAVASRGDHEGWNRMDWNLPNVHEGSMWITDSCRSRIYISHLMDFGEEIILVSLSWLLHRCISFWMNKRHANCMTALKFGKFPEMLKTFKWKQTHPNMWEHIQTHSNAAEWAWKIPECWKDLQNVNVILIIAIMLVETFFFQVFLWRRWPKYLTVLDNFCSQHGFSENTVLLGRSIKVPQSGLTLFGPEPKQTKVQVRKTTILHKEVRRQLFAESHGVL